LREMATTSAHDPASSGESIGIGCQPVIVEARRLRYTGSGCGFEGWDARRCD
jgi:hypothetical protein